MLLRLLISCILLFLPLTVVADKTAKSVTIYKFIDDQGVLHLTNKKPPADGSILFLYSRSYLLQPYRPPPAFPALPLPVLRSRNSDYTALLEAAGLRYRVPPKLLHAVIQVESNYNPRAISPKGAVGLMQLMAGTAKRYGVTDRTDPSSNIDGGAHYLRDLLTLFNDDLSLALAAYNAGENAVKKYGNTIPPYAETRQYVARVLEIYRQF